MRKVERGIIVGVVTALVGLAVWGGFGLYIHVTSAVDRWGEAGAGLSQTEARLNARYGVLDELDKDALATRSLIVHADLVARHEQQSLTTWDARAGEIYANLNDGVTDLRGTARAATAAIQEGQGLIADARPGVKEASATVKDLHAAVPDVQRTAKGTADTMGHVAGITGDTHKIADHYEAEIDNPKRRPWYIKILPTALQDIAQAALERYTLR